MFSVQINFRLLTIIVFALLLDGCGSMIGMHKVDDLYDMPLGQPARVYQATSEEAKQAALYAMKQTGAINIAEHQMNNGGWYVTGEIDYSWGSNGQFMRIAGQTNTGKPPKTQVFYTSIKRIDMNVTENLGLIRDKLLNLMDGYIESL